jgi:hypothetical protein
MTLNSQQSPATEVWRRFSGMFGADAVERKYGRTIPDEWHAMLSRLNDHQVQRGIRQLAYSGKAHVPALPEFVKLCRDAEHDFRPPAEHPAIAAPEWDRWLLAGNRRLMRYITTKAPEDPGRYGHREEPRFATNINTLVAMKNRWVEIMQDAAGPDGVPPDEQNECWRNCMREAEQLIAAERPA